MTVFGSNVAPRRRIFPARRTAWTCPACRKDNPKWAGNCLRCYTKAPHG